MLYSKIFWGTLIILFGLSIILNAVFKINFPFFKVFIALVIIYFGFRILFGSFEFDLKSKHGEHSSVFGSGRMRVENVGESIEYNSVFGSQTVDLKSASFTSSEAKVEVNSVFGSIKVILPERASVHLTASSAFGAVRMPNGEQISFGNTRKDFKLGEDPELTLYIEANAVFGSVELK